MAADPSRPSAREALQTALGFAAADKVDPAPPRPEVKALDVRIEAYRTATDAPAAAILAAVEARASMQADPAPYFAGAQILIDRGVHDEAIALAERGVAASDRFIAENESAYKMSGKSQGARARGRAAALDLVGWATFLKRDDAGAAAKLQETERLSRGLDVGNQHHLGARSPRRATNPNGRATTISMRCRSPAARRRSASAPGRRWRTSRPRSRSPVGSTRGSKRP